MAQLLTLVRGIAYSIVFVALVLIYLPIQIALPGLAQPARFGFPQIFGLLFAALAGIVVVWCIVTFALIGQGTPAPFDSPRRLITRGPYSHLRNPIYLSAANALTGAALFYLSLSIFAYACVFLVLAHVLVVLHEEPALEETFGDEYANYKRNVPRWWPTFSVGRK
ncbi:MAG TPA: isoprenylcysteine carboxylmethyltransferase family protein [Pyrinomonadaceae bacterium]|nr:isoprenylcysteine carboxylmethyltransferase family protein [Pyrinomonadaceae bacterium]